LRWRRSYLRRSWFPEACKIAYDVGQSIEGWRGFAAAAM
jgi:hypothetical protein